MAFTEFDENEAIQFIRKNAECPLEAYDDDDILLVIDTIFEYYEKYDECDDFNENAENVTKWVTKQLHKDVDNVIASEHVLSIVKAESKYEENLTEF